MSDRVEASLSAKALPGRTASLLSRRTAMLLATASLCLVGLGDYLMAWYFHFDFFYLLPLTLTALYVGRRAGLLMALACTSISTAARVLQQHASPAGLLASRSPVLVWNFFMHLALGCAFVWAVSRLREEVVEQRRLVAELQDAIADIKRLRELLPICAWCRRIRDDAGYWKQIDHYLQAKDIATFTHGICPECAAKLNNE
jgi:hypothetical protein